VLSGVDRRNPSRRPGSVNETLRVPVIDYAQNRLYRQAQARRARTPARPSPIVIDPDERSGPLAHPRLVRRSQPQIAVPLPQVFEDEPTGKR
jgi:hypothetical protein